MLWLLDGYERDQTLEFKNVLEGCTQRSLTSFHVRVVSAPVQIGGCEAYIEACVGSYVFDGFMFAFEDVTCLCMIHVSIRDSY